MKLSKMEIGLSAIGLLIVIAPLVLVAIHSRRIKESFMASQGGAMIQLMAGHVASEEEVAANLEYQKKRVTSDILNMTEPERFPGPKPARS